MGPIGLPFAFCIQAVTFCKTRTTELISRGRLELSPSTSELIKFYCQLKKGGRRDWIVTDGPANVIKVLLTTNLLGRRSISSARLPQGDFVSMTKRLRGLFNNSIAKHY